jgi:hypothetical protein
LPQPLLPFDLNDVKDVFLKKFSEVVSRNADVNVVVDLHGHADAVALSDAEAAGKHDLVLNTVLLHCRLKKLDDILRALEVAGRADANLYEQHFLHLCKNLLSEELTNALGGDRIEGVVHRYANTLLALAHAEGAAKLHLVTELVFGNQILKLFYYLTGALDVAGASDTNCNFKHIILPLNIH